MNIKINTQNYNPLIQSFENRDLNKFRLLIEDGMNINCTNHDGISLIALVVRAKEDDINKEFFNILMKNNVRIDPIGKSPNLLITTLLFQRYFFFEKLVNAGININTRNKNCPSDRFRDAVIFEILNTGKFNFVDLILNQKINLSISDKYGDTVLINFIKFNASRFTKEQSVSILRRIIDSGDNTNDRGADGMMAIHCAVYYELNYILDVLLEDKSCAELNSRDMLGNTALIYTASNNNFEGTKKLIEKGADLNIFNAKNESALFLSIVYRNENIFNLLLDNNAAIADIDKKGNNILHKMISYEWYGRILNIKCYEKIINKHPELALKKNNDGKTPIDLLTKGNVNHHNKRLINSFIKKDDKDKFKNHNGIFL